MGKSNGILSTITDIFSTTDMRERAADKKARKAKASITHTDSPQSSLCPVPRCLPSHCMNDNIACLYIV